MKGNSFSLPKTITSMFLVVVCLLIGTGSGNLIAADQIKFGAVIARSVVLDENDQPILVEFDDVGEEVRVVNVPNDYKNDVDSLKIISASDFRFYVNQLEEYKVDHVSDLAVGAILMDRNEFLNQTFVAADNTTSYSYPPGVLPESVKSVFVRGKSNRILPSPQELLLLSFSVDLKNSVTPVLEGDKSLLLSPEGVVIYRSENTIAYRVGFYGNPNEPQNAGGFRENDDEIFGPVADVKVFVSEFAYPGGVAATSAEGKYSFVFKLPQCPLGGFEFTTDVWAELKYKNFLPTGSPDIPYFIRKQEWSYCFAGLRSPLPLSPPVYTEVDLGATHGQKSDLRVDVMFLTGHAKLTNLDGSVVEIGSETKFKAFDEEEQVTQLIYDFNGDGKPDITVKGLKKTIQDEDGNDVNDVFVAETFLSGSEEPDLQGIYFNQEDVPGSSEDILDKQPEFTRLLDFEKRIEGGISFTDNDLQDNADLAESAVGVLETISEEDYKNTDILFFRESTGELVMERRGLRDEEVKGRNSTDFNDDEDSFSYRVMLRGPRDTSINVGGGSRTGGYEQWASDNFLSEPFQKREANHLKPGEFVRVVAINRATGYVGTQRVQLKSAGEKLNNQLSVEVDDIEMRPPNLKIWAERDFEVEQGLTAGEDRNFVVGNEGAVLTSDTTVTIFTEWLDHDGTPLPDGLGADNGEQYGFTGRLAKIVSPNTLQAASTAGSNLAEFPIAPGRKFQAVNVKSNLNSAEHYYIHAVGKAKDQECLSGATCPDFSTGNAAPPYDSRPSVFTPFLTPLFDENNHWETFNSFLELQRENQNDPSQITRPPPSYVWQYRPEYQFSQFDFEIREISRIANEGQANENRTNILDFDAPIISGSDDLIEALYSFLTNEFDRLTPIDGEQELVLALGEEEQLITIENGQPISFSNLAHLSSLAPEDFLSMRLYANNDAGNILWEWAFGFIALFPERDDTEDEEANKIYVSADAIADGPEYLVAFSDGVEGEPTTLKWQVTGQGASVTPSFEVSDEDQFSVELSLPTQSGSEAIVTVFGNDSDVPLGTSPTYVVVPGIADQLTITQNGSTTIGGFGNVELEIEAFDRYGNKVDDGTAITVSAEDVQILGEAIVENGIARVEVSGNLLAGELPVSVSVGGASEEVDVLVHDVELTFAAIPNVPINSTVPVQLIATSTGPLAGVTIQLAAHRGRLSTPQVVLDGSGIATVSYESGKYRGFAQLSAKVTGTDTVHTESFGVSEPGDFLVSNVLVVEGSGSVNLGLRSIDYSNQTELVINAQPGEVVSPSLFDPFMPPMFALQDYNADRIRSYNPSRTINVVPDLSSGIDATAHDAALVNSSSGLFARNWYFNGGSQINIPEHPRTSNLNEAGITLQLKLPESIASATTLIDWDDYGLRLIVNTDGTLTLSGNGLDSLTSSNPLALSEWHKIAIHYYSGHLYLGVDGVVEKLDVSAQNLSAFNAQSYAIRVQSAGLNGLELADLKVFDWQGEQAITFMDGSLEASSVADASGIARLGIQAKAPTFAYNRPYYRPSEIEVNEMYAAISHFVPRAYAVPLVSPECESNFAPVSANAVDPLIDEAERFLTVLLECLVKPKVVEARINYETSNGVFEKSVTLVKRSLYEGLYQTLNSHKDSAIMIANCLDAAVTGSNISAAGITCDIITSFLLIGDVRDILIQSWHYWVGDRQKYDQFTHALASIGAIGSLFTLAYGAGAPVNVLSASGKIVSKFFKLVPGGPKAAKVLGAKLAKIVDDHTLSRSQKVDEFVKFVPLIEITASLTFTFKTEPELFRVMAELLSIPRGLDNATTWVKRYVEEQESQVASQRIDHFYEPFPLWSRDYLPEPSFAATASVIKIFKKQLSELIEVVGEIPTPEKALRLDSALDILSKHLDDIEKNIGKIDDFVILKAFVVAQRGGGDLAAKSLTRMRIFPQNLQNAGFKTRSKFVEAISLFPMNEIEERLRNIGKFEDFQKEFAKLLETIGKRTPSGATSKSITTLNNNAKGAYGQILSSLNRFLAGNSDDFTEVFEQKHIVHGIIKDGVVGTHVADQIKASGKNVEVKFWVKTYLELGFRRALSTTAKESAEDSDKIGQMLLDIIDFRKTRSFKFEWEMTGDLAKQGVKEGDLADIVMNLITEDKAIEQSVRRALDLLDNDAAWEEFLVRLAPALKDDFFKVVDYDHILSKL